MGSLIGCKKNTGLAFFFVVAINQIFPRGCKGKKLFKHCLNKQYKKYWMLIMVRKLIHEKHPQGFYFLDACSKPEVYFPPLFQKSLRGYPVYRKPRLRK